jgi:beta-alanine--pyruvate transaminase
MGSFFGADEFGVIPDMMTFAKQVTNGTQPLGGVIAKQDIYQCFIGNSGPEHRIELPHGYTYSGHPVACAAALATLDILENEALPQRVKAMSKTFENALHSLKGLPNVVDIRNYGFAGALTIEGIDGDSALRPYQIALRCWEKGLYLRNGGNTIQLGLPFTTEKEEIDRVINILGEAIGEVG